MGDVVASIRDIRGASISVEQWLFAVRGAETGAVANRFSMSVQDARRMLKRLEREGKVTSRMANAWHDGWGGRTLVWSVKA